MFVTRFDEQQTIELAHELKCLTIRFLCGEISLSGYQKELYRLVQNLEHSDSQHAELRRH